MMRGAMIHDTGDTSGEHRTLRIEYRLMDGTLCRKAVVVSKRLLSYGIDATHGVVFLQADSRDGPWVECGVKT